MISALQRTQEWLATMTSLQSLGYTTNCMGGWVGRLTCLTSLEARSWSKEDEHPESFMALTSLVALRSCKLSGFAMRKLPDVFSGLLALQKLDLSSCNRLELLPNSITALTALQTCILSYCNQLQQLPEGLHSLQALRSLDLSRCSSLRRLPESFTALSSLQLCSLEDCRSLSTLPLHTGTRMQLQLLCIHGCNSMKLIPDALAPSLGMATHNELQCLQPPRPEARLHLDLSGMRCLKAFPSAENELRSLTLQHCHALEVLPATLSRLQKLDLSFCQSLQGLPPGTGSWPHLERLVLMGCTSLHFSEPAGSFPSLQHLDLSGCPHICLPTSHGCLAKIQHLRLAGGTLKRSYLNGTYQRLMKPDLWECKQLRHLLEFLQTHAGLQTLDVAFCRGLDELPEALQHVPGLQGLCANGLYQQVYEGLWATLPGLVSLQYLTIDNCNCLSAEAIFQMSSLTMLQLSGTFCQNGSQPNQNGSQAITELPDIYMPRLQMLAIAYCPSLQLLPAGLGNLPQLHTLELTGCSGIQQLPATFSRLASLHDLLLKGCNSLQVSPEDLRPLRSLSYMQLDESLESRMLYIARALPEGDRFRQLMDPFQRRRYQQLPPINQGQHKHALWVVPAIIAALVGVGILRRAFCLIGRPLQAQGG